MMIFLLNFSVKKDCKYLRFDKSANLLIIAQKIPKK